MSQDAEPQKKSRAKNERWKKTQTVRTFVIDGEGIDTTTEKLQELLLEAGYEKKDALRLRFALDVLLVDWYEHGLKDAPAELFAVKVLGQKKLVVEVQGKVNSDELEKSFQSFPWANSLKENGLVWSSSQTSTGMRAELVISKKRMGAWLSFLLAVAAAVATVLVLSALPGDALVVANKMLFNELFDIGVGLLTALVGPMVFLSIMAGMIKAGDVGTLKHLGVRSLAYSMQSNVLGLVVAIVGALVILGTQLSLSGELVNYAEELLGPIFSIIPTSFFQPFLDGNVLQIAIWAVIFGITAMLMKSRIPLVSDVIMQMDSLVQQVIMFVARIMPFFVYLALVRLVSSISGDAVFLALQALVVLVLASVFTTGILVEIAARRRKMGFGKMLKTVLPVLTTAFLTASSVASYSLTCETMKKLSIKETVLNIHTPIAVSIAHPGCVLDLMVAVAIAACLGDYSIGVSELLLMVLLSFVLGVATPSAPGGSIAVYALAISAMGFDASVLPVIIAISSLADMFCTVPNVAAIISTGLQVDSDEKNMAKDHA